MTGSDRDHRLSQAQRLPGRRRGESPPGTAPQQEASRRAAQYALLTALRRVYPAPLVELRDGLLAAPAAVQTTETTRPPARSKARQAAIRDARRRIQVLAATANDPPVMIVDFNGWADRWRLHALLDLAPYLRAYWRKRPAAGARFEFALRIVPMRPQVPIEFDADRDSEEDAVALVKALYAEHARTLPEIPAHRRHQLEQFATWYVQKHVQGWTLARIASETPTAKDAAPTARTIRYGLAEFTRLLAPAGEGK